MSQASEMDPDHPNQYRRNPSRAGYYLWGFLALAVIVTGGAFLANRAGDLIPKGPAPEIKAMGWENGEAPTKESMAGKLIVINVWATWCTYCRQEAPRLVFLQERYAKQGVVFIGLTTDGPDKIDEVHLFLKSTGITWPNGWGAGLTVQALRAESLPASYIIGPDGRLLWSSFDGGQLHEMLEQAVRQTKRNS